MKVFAKNYRGFSFVEIDLEKINFLVGDNSSGKSSILYLIHAVSRDDLNSSPRFDEKFGVGQYDYFSPYFDYRDVVFGYSVDDDNGSEFVKLITVRRRRDGPPIIVKCSYFVSGKFVSVKRVGPKKYYKVNDFDAGSKFDPIEMHEVDSGYKSINSSESISLGNPSFVLASLDCKELGIRNAMGKAFEYVLDSTRLISPIRALPEKFYSFRRKFDTHGLHFATMWMDLSRIEKLNAFKDIEKFGQESGLFDRIIVRKISDRIEESPLLVLVEKSGKEFLLNQVGVGVSQVIPVLMESVFALGMRDASILIQQPELHLHPVAQSALGSYLFKVARDGLRGVIETHSSFLLDRFRADLRDMDATDDDDTIDMSSSDVAIHFCENTSDGNLLHEISVGSDGSISGEPDKYHEFFVDEIVRTMF